MKHDVSLSHEGGDLSLGLLKKEKRALPCNQVSPQNPQLLENQFRILWPLYSSHLQLGNQSFSITTQCPRYQERKKLAPKKKSFLPGWDSPVRSDGGKSWGRWRHGFPRWGNHRAGGDWWTRRCRWVSIHFGFIKHWASKGGCKNRFPFFPPTLSFKRRM